MIESGPMMPRSVQINPETPLTLIGANLLPLVLLTAPMRARFWGFRVDCNIYSTEFASTMWNESARNSPENHQLPNKRPIENSRKKWELPEICNALLRRVRDFCAQIKGNGKNRHRDFAISLRR